MGISLFSKSTFDYNNNNQSENLPNPNPKKYQILREKRANGFLIIKIHYPDCTNYEGNKILVFKNCTIVDLITQERGIDPHFSDNKELISPIARFKPDDEGWKMAEFFISNFK